jgi:ubiquinone/menaquinone biosynthesis C-methylase UbiE
MTRTESIEDYAVAVPPQFAAALMASPSQPTVQTTGSPEIQTVKARQKAMWESGDYGQVARCIMSCAEEFMARLPLKPGTAVLDVACGSGNLAVISARRGCVTKGVDIATNLIAQARERAEADGLSIEFVEGDAEALPYPEQAFDAVISMYGAMFAPRPHAVAAELFRVTKPGGFVAMANWTPGGFIGKMFEVFKAYLPPPPGIPSPMLWGDEATVRERLKAFAEVKLTRRMARMWYPFPPAETVDFFRRYYGPTGRAFDALRPDRQAELRRALVELQAAHNASGTPGTTEAPAEYLEVIAVRT